MDWINVDKKQHLGIVKERNLYRKLLDECLHAFNEMHRQSLSCGSDTYKIATKIEQLLQTEKSIRKCFT